MYAVGHRREKKHPPIDVGCIDRTHEAGARIAVGEITDADLVSRHFGHLNRWEICRILPDGNLSNRPQILLAKGEDRMNRINMISK